MFQEIASWFAELGITYKVLSGGGMKSKMYAEKEDVDILIASLGALSKLTTVGKQSKMKMIITIFLKLNITPSYVCFGGSRSS